MEDSVPWRVLQGKDSEKETTVSTGFQRTFNVPKNKEMDKIKASKPSLLQATMYKKTMCKKQKADETLDSPLENI